MTPLAGGSPLADPFAPPATPRAVRCRRCGKTYASAAIEWRELPRGWPIDGAWCCPTPGCVAVGFGFDIREIKHSDPGATGCTQPVPA